MDREDIQYYGKVRDRKEGHRKGGKIKMTRRQTNVDTKSAKAVR
jgi:hypothetical protein